jgi:NhaP-type Na+/H+ or K+/H+ antiporter
MGSGRGGAARLVVAAAAALVRLGAAQNCATNNVLDTGSGEGACANIIAQGTYTCAVDFVHGGLYAGVCNYECGLNVMDVSLGVGQCDEFIAAGGTCAAYFAAGQTYAGYCDFSCGYCSHAPPPFDCSTAETGTVYIGGLFDSVDSEAQQHFEFAAGMLSSNNDGWFDELLPGIEIATRALNPSCDATSGTDTMWELSQNWRVVSQVLGGALESVQVPLHGVIGPGCEAASKGVGTLGRLQEIPQISGQETSPALSDTEAYPYHFRTVAPGGRETRQLKALLASSLLNLFRVGIIYTDTPEAQAAATDFVDTWTSAQSGAGTNFRGGILSQCKVAIDPDTEAVMLNSTQQCFSEINDLPASRMPRVIVLAAGSEHGAAIVEAAVDFYRPGGFKGWDTGRLWVALGAWAEDNAALQFGSEASFVALRPSSIDAEDCSDFEFQNGIANPACIHREYLEKWQTHQELILGVVAADVDQQLCERCAETVDALLALVTALDAARCDVEAQGMHNLEHGDVIRDYLRNVTFDGLSGQIAFDEQGDRATSKFGFYYTNTETADPTQWTRLATLIASSQGGVEPETPEAEDGQPPPPPPDLTGALLGDRGGFGDTYADSGFCRDGTECRDLSKPHCDVDYDPAWIWQPGAKSLVDGIPRNEARGQCVSHETFTSHSCAAPMYLHQDARGSSHHMTLYNADTTSCYQKNASSVECRKGGRDQGATPEPANVVAGMCADYLPNFIAAEEKGRSREVQVCCKVGDSKLENWFLERWQDQEVRFGQCENCRNAARKVLCQTACDVDNWRFHASSKGLSTSSLVNTSLEDKRTTSDAVVCPRFCKNVYQACREVVWTKEIKFMPAYRTPENPEEGMYRFCKEGLRLEIADEETWDGLGGAWSVDDNDALRICTEDSFEEDIHCTSEQAYRTKGAVGAILCVFAVVALLLTDMVTNRMLPAASITLLMGLTVGLLINEVLSGIEEDVRGTHDLVNTVLLKPQALSLFLLPVMIFSSAFNMEHHVTIFMWLTIHRVALFALLGTFLSVCTTGGLLFILNGMVDGGLLEYEMRFEDAMMYGSLICAVDPSASLQAFARIGIDPRVYSLVYGESILCRMLCVVFFGVFKKLADRESQDDDTNTQAAIRFFELSFGSLACGLALGVFTTLLFKYFGDPPESEEELRQMQSEVFQEQEADQAREIRKEFRALDKDGDGAVTVSDLNALDLGGDAELEEEEFKAKVLKSNNNLSKQEMHHKRHKAMADAATFFFSSLSSYYASEALGLSGIIGALACAVVCNQFAVRNMTFDAREYGK